MRLIFVILSDHPSIDIFDYFIQLMKMDKMIDHEDYKGYFDQKVFNILLSKISKEDENYPNIGMVRNYFSSWTHYSSLEKPSEICIEGKILTDDIMGIIIHYPNELHIDHNVFNSGKITVIETDNGAFIKAHKVDLRPCSELEVYSWFTENRNPGRNFDDNYLKHSRFKERYVDGKKVSPLTLPEKDLEAALRKAVGQRGEKRLYFYDATNKLLLVFYNENQNNLFHGHEILDKDKKQEVQKISNPIKKKIETVFNCKFIPRGIR